MVLFNLLIARIVQGDAALRPTSGGQRNWCGGETWLENIRNVLRLAAFLGLNTNFQQRTQPPVGPKCRQKITVIGDGAIFEAFVWSYQVVSFCSIMVLVRCSQNWSNVRKHVRKEMPTTNLNRSQSNLPPRIEAVDRAIILHCQSEEVEQFGRCHNSIVHDKD